MEIRPSLDKVYVFKTFARTNFLFIESWSWNSECLYKYNIYITYHMQNIYIKNIYRKYGLLNKIVYIYE